MSDDIKADLSDSDFATISPAGVGEDGPEHIWSIGPPIPWVQIHADLQEEGLGGYVAYDTITGKNLILNILPRQDGVLRRGVDDVPMQPPSDPQMPRATIHPGDPVKVWTQDGAWQSGLRAVSEVYEGDTGCEIKLCWDVEWRAAAAEHRAPAALPWPAELVRPA